jgi:hypothetical protein
MPVRDFGFMDFRPPSPSSVDYEFQLPAWKEKESELLLIIEHGFSVCRISLSKLGFAREQVCKLS